MKKYIAVFEVEDDCNILTMDAEIKYTYETNGTNYIMQEDIEFVRVEEQQPCEDCISREEALMALTGDITDCTVEEYIVRLRGKLSKLPPVVPKSKTGHWIFDEILDRHYYCSECKSMGVDYWDYCPECGARMIEPQESEDKDADSN